MNGTLPTGTLTIDDLKAEVEAGRIDTVVVAMTDMAGQLVGKRFHARYFLDGGAEETHACDYLLANDIDMEPVPGYVASSWDRGYGDFTLKPDLATLRRIPWLEGTALVLSDVLDHHHDPVPHSPRAILKRQLHRLETLGMRAFFASELEFYLFDESHEAISARHFHDPKPSSRTIKDYSIYLTTKDEPVMRAIRNGLQSAAIPIENSKGEWGPGQEEINIRYADALEMADRHVILKNAVKEIARAQGKAVTFMAKWRYDLAGSSSHIHQSLWDAAGTTPLFAAAGRPHGMSVLMEQWLAGQLAHAGEVCYFLAPYINSYKRFQAGTFAPTKAVWSVDNRTAGFRLCGAGTNAVRVECRMGGADLNPYLAFAALIAAGLAGIENAADLEPPFAGDAYRGGRSRQIPKTLRAATDALRRSKMLRAAMGDAVIDHYVHAAEWEQFEYDRRITDWELHRVFERY
jgi:glutamine synthetase